MQLFNMTNQICLRSNRNAWIYSWTIYYHMIILAHIPSLMARIASSKFQRQRTINSGVTLSYIITCIWPIFLDKWNKSDHFLKNHFLAFYYNISGHIYDYLVTKKGHFLKLDSVLHHPDESHTYIILKLLSCINQTEFYRPIVLLRVNGKYK